MLTLIYFCIVLGLLVCVHEFGHFAAAKLCGVYVERFSIGFGPTILQWKGKETTYCISLIPLGGYVQMAGQSDLPDEEQKEAEKDIPPERFYSAKTVWQRLCIILAGPGMNLFFALPLAVALLCYGEKVAILPDGITVSQVIQGSPADAAGIAPGDRILKLNGEPVTTWNAFVEEIRANLYSPVTLTTSRDGKDIELSVTPDLNEEKGYLGLGIAMSPPAQVEKIASLDSPLREGDVFLAIEGLPSSSCSFEELSQTIRALPDTNITVTVANYKKSRRADESQQPEKRTVKLAIGKKKKCQLFDIVNVDGRARLSLRPGAPESLWSLEGAKILALNDRPLALSQEDYFEACGIGSITACVAVAAQSGKYRRETLVTTLVSRVEYMGHAGILLKPASEMVREPFLSALKKSPAKAWAKVVETLRTLKLLFAGSLKVNNLSGPVGIARMTGAAAQRGFDVLLNFVLLITVNLGVLNLLPLPVLDGGHVVLLIAEGIRRKPLPEKFLLWYQRIGLMLLLALFALVMLNDVGRWIKDSEFLGTLLGKFFR
ncbi:site-2 protease family protein [bacterium]|nr:site-2 protease family protein [bacterium]